MTPIHPANESPMNDDEPEHDERLDRLCCELSQAREASDARTRDLEDIMHWAQAILTALNVGNVESESKLHLKLRELMIAYREKYPRE